MLVSVPMPLPDRGIASGLLLALPVRVTAPVRVPDAAGVNFTVTVQEAPTARVEQVFVWLKSPLAETAETVADVVPVLVTVTAWVADGVPTMVPGKDRLAGVGLRTGPVATEPKPTAVGLIEMSDPLSGRYGGNVGVKKPHCDPPKMPELPPPSVSVNGTPQL